MNYSFKRFVACVAVALIMPAIANAQESKDADRKAFRVCADPNNLPFSNQKKEGFENKIAEVLAQDMGLPIEYTWYPQRFGFVRNTLRARVGNDQGFKCDLVVGVPDGWGEASTTKPYFTSTYALAYIKGKGLDSIKAQEDLLKLDPEKLKQIKFGVFAQSPAVDWLLKYKLFDQAVLYQKQTGDPAQYPGQVIEKDLVDGKIDVAFVWGPIAGFFAKKISAAEVAVVPMHSEKEIRFDYAIAMGVRHPDKEWKAQIEKAIASNRGKIDQILNDYGVPLVAAAK